MAYHCHVCGKNFERMQSLSNHARTHPTGEMLIPCIHCNKSYANRNALRRHFLEIHEDEKRAPVPSQLEKPHKCKECGKAYSYEAHLKLHIDAVHVNKGKLWTCPYKFCGKQFALKTSRDRHIRETKDHRPDAHKRTPRNKKTDKEQARLLLQRELARNAQMVKANNTVKI